MTRLRAVWRALDHALARRLLAVHDETGRAIDGEVTVKPGDRVWHFVPAGRWLAGRHHLLMSPSSRTSRATAPAGKAPRSVSLSQDDRLSLPRRYVGTRAHGFARLPLDPGPWRIRSASGLSRVDGACHYRLCGPE